MDALRAWGVFSVFRSPLFVVVGCWLLVFLHFFHYTPSTRHRKKKGDTMATTSTVAWAIIFSSVVIIFCFDSQLV